MPLSMEPPPCAGTLVLNAGMRSRTHYIQVDTLLALKRIAEHFAVACSSIKSMKEFDAVKLVVSGALAAVADRLIRCQARHTDDSAAQEPRESELSLLLNGEGGRVAEGFVVDPTAFLTQSETIEFYSPALGVARSGVANYFQEVLQHHQVFLQCCQRPLGCVHRPRPSGEVYLYRGLGGQRSTNTLSSSNRPPISSPLY